MDNFNIFWGLFSIFLLCVFLAWLSIEPEPKPKRPKVGEIWQANRHIVYKHRTYEISAHIVNVENDRVFFKMFTSDGTMIFETSRPVDVFLYCYQFKEAA